LVLRRLTDPAKLEAVLPERPFSPLSDMNPRMIEPHPRAEGLNRPLEMGGRDHRFRGTDVGIELSREYAEAVALLGSR
jgi:hypothetical protein